MLKLPNNKPRMTTAEIEALIKPFKIDRKAFPLVVVGIRGYYRDSMGKVGENDRGLYDDAIFISTPNMSVSYNGNTDPSSYRKGFGKGTEKGMASLNPGIYYAHKIGKHKGYQALAQLSGVVKVTRDGNPPYQDEGYFGINIHRGDYSSTSSAGCQTIARDQWLSFITNVVTEAKRLYGKGWSSTVIPYVLIEN